MKNEKYSFLVEKALEARKRSYSPYSHFAVGAALLTAEGEIFTGANIENASYTPTVCAERVALFSAVAAGYRSFTAIAIVGGPSGTEPDEICPPCGVCLQVMSEFCTGELAVILSDGVTVRELTLDGLLPHRFSLDK